MNIKITVNTYAGLKDYFGSGFPLEFNSNCTINDLIVRLKNKKPESSNLLLKCRFALNHEIVENQKVICSGDIIDILPPSSGG